MAEFSLLDEQRHVAELASRLADEVVSPAARDAERAGSVSADVWKRLLDSGLSVPVAEEYGGAGLADPLTQLLFTEGLAQGDAAVASAVTWTGAAALMIGQLGTSGQREALLPAFVADPTLRAAVALHEGFGRPPSEYATVFERTGDAWRIRGRKVAVAFGSTAAPLLVVGAESTTGRVLVAVLSSAATGGITATSTAGNLGFEAAPMATLDIDVLVGEEDILGGPAAEADAVAGPVSHVRLQTAALSIGCGQRAVNYAAEYAAGREAFGRPIASFQGVAFLLAEAQMQLDAARLEVWEAAARLAAGDLTDIERITTLAVNYAGRVATAATRDALQVLGGHGFITDHPVELWYRQAATLAAIDFDPSASAFAPAH